MSICSMSPRVIYVRFVAPDGPTSSRLTPLHISLKPELDSLQREDEEPKSLI